MKLIPIETRDGDTVWIDPERVVHISPDDYQLYQPGTPLGENSYKTFHGCRVKLDGRKRPIESALTPVQFIREHHLAD